MTVDDALRSCLQAACHSPKTLNPVHSIIQQDEVVANATAHVAETPRFLLRSRDDFLAPDRFLRGVSAPVTLIALLQARNEQRFLPGWLENVAPCVDGIIALDDGSIDATAEILRAHPKVIELLSNPPGRQWDERGNQMALVQAGRRHGAGWFLCVDADERLERAFATNARDLLREADAKGIDVYSLQLRDLWGDRRHYRCDGIWNQTIRFRLFRNNPTHRKFDPRPLHRLWMPLEIAVNSDTRGRHSEINLYHLRLIAAADRAARVARYQALDPLQLYQGYSYSRFTDETGLRLQEIPPERDFLPQDDPAIQLDR
ncbi:MAG: glycosyltransferase family 2 protein [Dongiaceae bacterium]